MRVVIAGHVAEAGSVAAHLLRMAASPDCGAKARDALVSEAARAPGYVAAAVAVAGHVAEEGSEAASLLEAAADLLHSAAIEEAGGHTDFAGNDEITAAEFIDRAKVAPGYLGPAPSPSETRTA